MHYPLPSNPPPRILVADDDNAARGGTVDLLAQLGFHASEAIDGEEVLEDFVQTGYDIIFMDCQMPRLDGYEATERIRGLEGGFRQPVIVALTSLVTESNRARCLSAGMDDFLSKPAHLEELSKCLDRWLPQGNLQGNFRMPEDSRTERGADELKLMRLFLNDAPKRLAEMRVALDARNATDMERAAHTLKGSSGVVGAMHLARRCEVMETLSEFGLFEQARNELQLCEVEFHLVHNDLEEKITQTERGLRAGQDAVAERP